MNSLVVIPSKAMSIRCPNKNEYLLPIALTQIKDVGIDMNNVVVCAEKPGYISDIAKRFGAKFMEDPPCPDGEGSSLLPLEKAYDLYGENFEDILYVSSTYPFKSKYMFSSIVQKRRTLGCQISAIGYVQKDLTPLIHKVSKESLKINNNKMGEGVKRQDVVYVCDSLLCLAPSVCREYKYASELKEFWKKPSMAISKFEIPFYDVDEELDLEIIKCLYPKFKDIFWKTTETL
jgi:hypothetical protein